MCHNSGMLRRDETGASMVEFGMLLALTVAVFAAAAWALGSALGFWLEDMVCDEKEGYACCAPERGYTEACTEP